MAKANSQRLVPFSLWEEINEKTKMAFFKDKTKSCFLPEQSLYSSKVAQMTSPLAWLAIRMKIKQLNLDLK